MELWDVGCRLGEMVFLQLQGAQNLEVLPHLTSQLLAGLSSKPRPVQQGPTKPDVLREFAGVPVTFPWGPESRTKPTHLQQRGVGRDAALKGWTGPGSLL